jgi:hypothetical protein
MTYVRRMNPDSQNIERGIAKRGRSSKRGGEAEPCSTGPGDHRTSRKPSARRWRPDAEVIFGELYSRLVKRPMRALSIEPGGGNEASDRPAGYIFDQCAALSDPQRRLGRRKAEKLALASGHYAGAETGALILMSAVVAVGKAVEEHLDAGVGPPSQARCKGRSWNDWSVTPVIGHNEHC